ncbi:hypothetical protein ACH4FX_11200 [Streptomyces sp. NPDC018019]|uniref:hypothetical protein n=1 Tax=Streptomyces sp. NPDC018019 TaxID=3365030 RepID=UPI0037879C72
MVRHATRKRAAQLVKAASGVPYSVARQQRNSLRVISRDVFHHPYIAAVIKQLDCSGVSVLHWFAKFDQGHRSAEINFSPCDGAAGIGLLCWEYAASHPRGWGLKTCTTHTETIALLPGEVAPRPSDLVEAVKAAYASEANEQPLIEYPYRPLVWDTGYDDLSVLLSRYVSSAEKLSGVARCCAAGSCYPTKEGVLGDALA